MIYCDGINYEQSTRLYYYVDSKQTEVIYVCSGDFGPVHSRSDPCNLWAFMGSARNPLRSKQNGHHFANDIFNAFGTNISIFFVQNPLMFLQYGSNWQYLINGSDNDLVSQGWQAIAWTNDHPVHNTSVTRPHFVKAASLTMIHMSGQSNHGGTIPHSNTLLLAWLEFNLSTDK